MHGTDSLWLPPGYSAQKKAVLLCRRAKHTRRGTWDGRSRWRRQMKLVLEHAVHAIKLALKFLEHACWAYEERLRYMCPPVHSGGASKISQ